MIQYPKDNKYHKKFTRQHTVSLYQNKVLNIQHSARLWILLALPLYSKVLVFEIKFEHTLINI